MHENESLLACLLSEVLRLQRWAGGDNVSAARIFALMNGFEKVIAEETATTISEETQAAVEKILAEIDEGSQPADGMSVKSRLHEEKIDDTAARKVATYCRFRGWFPEAFEKLNAKPMGPLTPENRTQEQDWTGSLHYMELHDSTEGAEKKLHAVFSPAVPRVGEFITPQAGSAMRVVSVEYIAQERGGDDGLRDTILVPYIYLEAIEDED